jgi:hypothetical protein
MTVAASQIPSKLIEDLVESLVLNTTPAGIGEVQHDGRWWAIAYRHGQGARIASRDGGHVTLRDLLDAPPMALEDFEEAHRTLLLRGVERWRTRIAVGIARHGDA